MSASSAWAMLNVWAIIMLECCCLFKRPLFLSIVIKNQFSLIKKISLLFIPLRSLTFYKLNLFRCTCDFPIRWIIILDLQWRVSYYLKGLLWPNINWNKIINIKTKINVLTCFKKCDSLSLCVLNGRLLWRGKIVSLNDVSPSSFHAKKKINK